MLHLIVVGPSILYLNGCKVKKWHSNVNSLNRSICANYMAMAGFFPWLTE